MTAPRNGVLTIHLDQRYSLPQHSASPGWLICIACLGKRMLCWAGGQKLMLIRVRQFNGLYLTIFPHFVGVANCNPIFKIKWTKQISYVAQGHTASKDQSFKSRSLWLRRPVIFNRVLLTRSTLRSSSGHYWYLFWCLSWVWLLVSTPGSLITLELSIWLKWHEWDSQELWNKKGFEWSHKALPTHCIDEETEVEKKTDAFILTND